MQGGDEVLCQPHGRGCGVLGVLLVWFGLGYKGVSRVPESSYKIKLLQYKSTGHLW